MPSMAIMFLVLVVFSFLWLLKPWASGLIQVSPSCVALLPEATTIYRGVSQGQAFYELLQQVSVKLWSYNAKMLLRYISLLPVTESDALDHSLFSLENSSHSIDVNFNGIPCCAESVGSLVSSQVSGSSSSLHIYVPFYCVT